MATPARPDVVVRWHHIVEHDDRTALVDLLADDAVFSSPAVFTPQAGKDATLAYLQAALTVFGNDTGFHYVGEWYGDRSAVLEFEADLDGVHVNGVDIIGWDHRDRIISFKVMVRPIKGLQALMPLMAAQLTPAATPSSLPGETE
ncbi:nuclear transport factor 2 family protein [Rhodococcus chondri]|uniref:Nuclear transport factor 2 family protein n=1 Tax=Rhodococcus chondri TaxID=3065941 RepID=A0ABU7JL44_9NOCA|nr:nuclear transport factor 2 family protein [Rhodococcus sp. CC-R104]MEE2030753.1 nuclear transport factor 2 family protein [Rhodococcus sp. CC-R104]